MAAAKNAISVGQQPLETHTRCTTVLGDPGTSNHDGGTQHSDKHWGSDNSRKNLPRRAYFERARMRRRLRFRRRMRFFFHLARIVRSQLRSLTGVAPCRQSTEDSG